jgi:hypothetical protein
MEKTWKPVTAGILNIISGTISVFGVIGVIIAIAVTSCGTGIMQFIPPRDLPFVGPLISTVLIIVLVFTLIEAVFPILGGVFALQRKKWGWALAGSILAILGAFPLGIASTIFVSLARDEFEKAPSEAPPTD